MGHLRLLAGGDPIATDYLVKWHAQIVQAPGGICRIAIVLRSVVEGDGKNLWLDWFGEEVLGKDLYFSTADIDKLLGKFAIGQHQKLLINLDETKGRDTFASGDRIKNAITAKHTQYEAKGRDAVETANYARWAFTTNNKTPVSLGPTDRRFACFDCCEDFANDAEYVDSLQQWMKDDRPNFYSRNFYSHLKAIDLTGMDWIKDRPCTKLWEELREVNIPVTARFAQHAVVNGLFQKEMAALKIYEVYKSWAEQSGVQGSMTMNRLGRELKSTQGVEFTHTRTGSHYRFNAQDVEAALVRKKLWVGVTDVDSVTERDASCCEQEAQRERLVQ